MSNRLDQTSISKLSESARRGELVVITGTGVSQALVEEKTPSLSWKGLIANGFEYGRQKGLISQVQLSTWSAVLNSNDIDDLLSAAEFMERKLGGSQGNLFSRWLEEHFKDLLPVKNDMFTAVNELKNIGVPICTLNYDDLLEKTTILQSINITEKQKVFSWMRRETQGILHLHGLWQLPDSCILGIRDYEKTIGDEIRDLIQRSLGTFRRLLFIGCGETFEDPNFSALIKWLRQNVGGSNPQHYALVKADEAPRRHADPSWHGFVEPISYGSSHAELPKFMTSAFRFGTKTVRKVGSQASGGHTNAKHAAVIDAYRAFILKDCGQMTIEGVRADMDTAQRRFDLERLFVPLEVMPSPPDISATDPLRDQTLIEWQKKNKNPVSFTSAFRKHKRLALLALPGGGKTMLLKRLAVAYADKNRRLTSNDKLPDLDLIPVLIRCREWREHIQKPLPTILRNMTEITGQLNLENLGEALIPALKSGRVLLLVDGLDEIHNNADRSIFVENIEKFLSDYPKIRLVVTSREAGFGLVAPCLARFCVRMRVAPLSEEAVTALCGHWHRLMVGTSAEAQDEAKELAERLLARGSLRSLAENPLLLTMLLVVKHGAGRLPPDRVSLYNRAVEVLLDTWNIKGHEALNLKEAVPQLACVAFELMRSGKQTATEKELLNILEDARERVPQIRRYAKDTPFEFLKRVELRSSLLLEAGHQLEGGKTVPFYQFRHLTFQEYLAAVAAVEGHYLDYQTDSSILEPLTPYLVAEDWKEVIPMAAVLARKQAAPLMAALVEMGRSLRAKLEAREDFEGQKEWKAYPGKLPPAVWRLVQCLIEEAEAPPETLTEALQIAVMFARGCQTEANWEALSRGPYGEELLHQAWLIYAKLDWPADSWMRNSFAVLAASTHQSSHWLSECGQKEASSLLRDNDLENIVRGLMICIGVFWSTPTHGAFSSMIRDIEHHIYHDDLRIAHAASWAWGLCNHAQDPAPLSTDALDRLLNIWTSHADYRMRDITAFAISAAMGTPRNSWTPMLSEQQKEQILQYYNSATPQTEDMEMRIAAIVVAYHSRSIWTDAEISEKLKDLDRSGYFFGHNRIGIMLGELRLPARRSKTRATVG